MFSFHKLSGKVRGDNPVALLKRRFAHDYDYDVLAASRIGMPSRKQAGVSHPLAAPDLIRVGKGLSDPIPMLRKKVGVILGNMPLSVFG